VRSLPVTDWNKHEELDNRIFHSAAEFDRICERYASTYGRFGWKAEVSGNDPKSKGRLERVQNHLSVCPSPRSK
jgi:hypothetical protein